MHSPADFQQSLLTWYDQKGRSLPWRAKGHEKPNPYYVWISEIMLQQTTVATVISYFNRFTAKWPTVKQLAEASLDEVLHAWQGLGYYSRARNLHKCARQLCLEHKGIFPHTEKELMALPGIGPYTAAAISAIAFQESSVVVDGNIERVMSRLFEIKIPLPAAKKNIKEVAASLTPAERPGDYAQALMDLGAMVCTPRLPRCDLCPVHSFCKAYGHSPENYPYKAAKIPKPTRKTVFFWIQNDRGEVFLERRPPRDLLGGMMGFPSTSWATKGHDLQNPLDKVEILKEKLLSGIITHTFTHFHLVGEVSFIQANHTTLVGQWVRPERFHELALPTLMKKVVGLSEKDMLVLPYGECL
ncbi:MAG: A/G-specific adenine glycosylase [Alphaproteobacteria bacterium]